MLLSLRARLRAPGFAAIDVAEGRLAQLVERLLYTQNVGGSSPSPPTIVAFVSGTFCHLSLRPLTRGALLGGVAGHVPRERIDNKNRPLPRNPSIAATTGDERRRTRISRGLMTNGD